MSRTIITRDGSIVYRTRPMSLSRAAAFARCIQANEVRFQDVLIVPARTRNEQYYVTFRPVNVERQGDMYEAQWMSRKERAARQEFIFWACDDRPGLWWCLSVASGETYEVTPFGCSCPDYQFRCENAAILCKHQQALEIQNGGRGEKQTETREERDARIRKNILRDF